MCGSRWWPRTTSARQRWNTRSPAPSSKPRKSCPHLIGRATRRRLRCIGRPGRSDSPTCRSRSTTPASSHPTSHRPTTETSSCGTVPSSRCSAAMARPSSPSRRPSTTSMPSSIPTASSAVRYVPTAPTASAATTQHRRVRTSCRGRNGSTTRSSATTTA